MKEISFGSTRADTWFVVGFEQVARLMVGHREHPSLEQGIFRRVLRDAGWDDADALFDRILEYNRTQFERLAAESVSAPPALAEMLRSVARSHLDAIRG